MKFLRKMLSAVVIVAMILSMSTAAFASSEAADGGAASAINSEPVGDNGSAQEQMKSAYTGEGMFKVVDYKIKDAQDGKKEAEVTLSSDGYYALIVGATVEEAKAQYAAGNTDSWIKHTGEKKYTDDKGNEKTGRVYTIPVEDTAKPIKLVSVSQKYYEQKNVEKMFNQRTILFDGEYTLSLENNAGTMFKGIEGKLTVKNGKANAEIMLSGSGYYALFVGTVDEAKASYETGDESKWIKHTNEKKYTNDKGEEKTGRIYNIPVEKANKVIELVSVSEKYYKQDNVEKMFNQRSYNFNMSDMSIALGNIVVEDDNKPAPPADTDKDADNTPAAPADTDKPETGDKTPGSNVPKTGDESNLTMFSAIALAALAAGIAAAKRRKEN